MRLCILDANERSNRRYAHQAVSVVAGWLRWELQQAGIPLCDDIKAADIILLVFAGAIDFVKHARGELQHHGIAWRRTQRKQQPYVIVGGPVDAIPFTALDIADAVIVGEGYRFVRTLLDSVKRGRTLHTIRQWICDYPHTIEGSQIEDFRRDPCRPWLLAQRAVPLAEPDRVIDWKTPAVRSDDNVIRILGSKGCHKKCGFCATTYRQFYQINPDSQRVLQSLSALQALGERVQILSNDPAALPYFRSIIGRLDSESFTIDEIRNPENRAAAIRSRLRIARFGVEGISERLRRAMGKAIAEQDILTVLADFHDQKINTHLFFIPGSPFEDAGDWDEFRHFYERLTRLIRSGLCRVKFTTFTPTPPAPLARFVPSLAYEDRMKALRQWIGLNAASCHCLYIRPRGGNTHIRDLAEQLGVSLETVRQLLAQTEETVDLAPSCEDAERLPWEIIRWPLSAAVRWKIGTIYRDRLIR